MASSSNVSVLGKRLHRDDEDGRFDDNELMNPAAPPEVQLFAALVHSARQSREIGVAPDDVGKYLSEIVTNEFFMDEVNGILNRGEGTEQDDDVTSVKSFTSGTTTPMYEHCEATYVLPMRFVGVKICADFLRNAPMATYDFSSETNIRPCSGHKSPPEDAIHSLPIGSPPLAAITLAELSMNPQFVLKKGMTVYTYAFSTESWVRARVNAVKYNPLRVSMSRFNNQTQKYAVPRRVYESCPHLAHLLAIDVPIENV